MKSIQERADKYIGHPYEMDEFSEVTSARRAYIAGSEEQHKIDVNKACDYVCATCIVKLDFLLQTSKECSREHCNILNHLKKAMEE